MNKELPDGWVWKEFSEIGSIFSGSTPSTLDDSNFDGDIPWVTPADLGKTKGMFIQRGQKNITAKGLKSSSIPVLPKCSVIFSSRAPIGYVAIAANEITTNQGCKNLVLNDGILPKYVLFYLRKNREYLESLGSGSTFKELSKARFSQVKIPIPPLDTQRQIVAILEKAETIRRLRVESNDLTQRLLQSMFLEMFGDPVTNPMGWKSKKLGEVSEVVSGVTKGRKLEGKAITKTPYLRVANVQDGFLDLSEIKDIEAIPSDISKYALLKGDILLTEGGDLDKLGRGAIWNEEIPNCIHQNHIFRVRIQNSNILPEYLSMLISSNYGKRYFLKAAKKTTGIASINSTQLKNFSVIIPPIEIQRSFQQFFSKFKYQTEILIKSLSNTTILNNILMAKAFTGELVA